MTWAGRAERGAAWPVRIMLRLVLALGWRAGAVLLPPITLYYLLTAASARAASRRFLQRALGRDVGWADLFRHFHGFAAVTLDRVFFLSGRSAGFRVQVEGVAALQAVLADGGGAILLGAHLGSFEVLRAISRQAPVRARALMYRRNRGALTCLLETLAPDLQESVIEIGRPDAMLRVGECLARGELVGILADRVPAGERAVPLPFLGHPAPFPLGPLQVASVLRAPVVLFHGVRTGPRCYRVAFEPFAGRVAPDREGRRRALEAEAARYVAWLEELCRTYPFNWFNFHDVWDDAGRGGSAAAGDGLSPAGPGG